MRRLSSVRPIPVFPGLDCFGEKCACKWVVIGHFLLPESKMARRGGWLEGNRVVHAWKWKYPYARPPGFGTFLPSAEVHSRRRKENQEEKKVWVWGNLHTCFDSNLSLSRVQINSRSIYPFVNLQSVSPTRLHKVWEGSVLCLPVSRWIPGKRRWWWSQVPVTGVTVTPGLRGRSCHGPIKLILLLPIDDLAFSFFSLSLVLLLSLQLGEHPEESTDDGCGMSGTGT